MAGKRLPGGLHNCVSEMYIGVQATTCLSNIATTANTNTSPAVRTGGKKEKGKKGTKKARKEGREGKRKGRRKEGIKERQGKG